MATTCGVKLERTSIPLHYQVGGLLSPRSIHIDLDTLSSLERLIINTAVTPFVCQRSIVAFRYCLTHIPLTVHELAPTALIIRRLVSHVTSNQATYADIASVLNKLHYEFTMQQILSIEVKLVSDDGFCRMIVLGYV